LLCRTTDGDTLRQVMALLGRVMQYLFIVTLLLLLLLLQFITSLFQLCAQER
jgi:hypothetical protein